MKKVATSVISSILISLIATMINYNPLYKQVDVGYSFIREFSIGALIVFFIFIIIFTPLSLFIDTLITAKFNNSRIASLLSYIIIPMLPVFIIFIIFSDLKNTSAMMVISGFFGGVYCAIQSILGLLISMDNKK